MRVAIDAQLTVGTATGIGEYVRGLIDALRANGIDAVELCDPKLDPWRFDRRVFWDQVMLPQQARAVDAELLHCASGTVPLGVNMPFVVTVHDVVWARMQKHARPYARYYFGRFSFDRYRKAAAIAVDSAFSREELLAIMPDLDPRGVRVVYPGVARDYCTLQRGRGDRSTILAIGTVERRKNLKMLIDALPFLEDARLVSVGPYTPYQKKCEAAALELGVEDRVDFLGYVERGELLELCSTAAVVAVPSLYEGFGYAAAQGMCAGVPVIVSDQASLPEIVRGGGRVVPAGSVHDWVDALGAALRGDDDARAIAGRPAAIERFSWAKSVRDMIATYEFALARAAA